MRTVEEREWMSRVLLGRERGSSGRMREAIRVLGLKLLLKREREGEEIAIMRRDGLRGC